MSEKKYAKYVIMDTPKNPAHPGQINTLWINDELNGALEGAFYIECSMVMEKDSEASPRDKAHNHDFDEYLIFLGTNPEDPSDLGGEVEIWLGDEEKYKLTKTCAIFVPKGMYHTPLMFNRVDRPIITIHAGNTTNYTHFSYSKDPKWADMGEPFATKS